MEEEKKKKIKKQTCNQNNISEIYIKYENEYKRLYYSVYLYVIDKYLIELESNLVACKKSMHK